jgi:hypothetical protein
MRRTVLVTCLLAVTAAGAAAAVAAPSGASGVGNQNICVVTSNDSQHKNIQYYCVTLPG